MMMKRACLLALAVLGILPVSAATAQPGAPRTGAYSITLSPGELLGEAARKVASVIPVDEPISWEVYVPRGYSAGSPSGVVVYVSPSPSGSPPPGWSSVMDEHNLIWISANESGNRVLAPRRALTAILALYAIQREYVLDRERVYVAGLSGGGKMASMIATDYAETFDGGFFICGVEPLEVDGPRQLEAIRANRYVFLAGERDQALKPTKRAYRQYQKAGVPNIQLVVVPGMGHDDPPRHEISKAIDFLDHGASKSP